MLFLLTSRRPKTSPNSSGSLTSPCRHRSRLSEAGVPVSKRLRLWRTTLPCPRSSSARRRRWGAVRKRGRRSTPGALGGEGEERGERLRRRPAGASELFRALFVSPRSLKSRLPLSPVAGWTGSLGWRWTWPLGAEELRLRVSDRLS